MANSVTNSIIEKLKGLENYSSWKFMMKMILIHDELWKCIEPGDDDVIKQEKALAKIALAVTPAIIPHIRNAKTAKEAWCSLQKAYEDRGLCRRLGLLRALFSIKLNESGSMELYLNKITDISQQLSEIESKLEDDFIAVIMLSGLSSDYDPLIMAMENSNTKLSSEVVKAKLLQENIRRSETRESTSALVAQKQPRCFKCKKTGHFFKDCHKVTKKNKPKKDSSQVLLTALSTHIKRDYWYIDSGATGHMCGNKDYISDYVNIEPNEVILADGNKLYTAGKGSVHVKLKDNVIKTIKDVFYVPNLSTNLLSVNAMVQRGYKVVFSSDGCQILDNSVVLATATLRNGIFQLDTMVYDPVQCNLVGNRHNLRLTGSDSAGSSSLPAESGDQSKQRCPDTATKGFLPAAASKGDAVITQGVWHRRLAHLNHRSMELLRKGMVDGISYDIGDFQQCIACIEGKQTRKPFPKKSVNRSTDILQLVHSDLCGPMPCTSFSGYKYFVTFIDDFTRKTFVYFLKFKSEVFDKFKTWKALVENQTNKRIKAIRTDNGGEYVCSKFQNFLQQCGIEHQTTVPYSPQQNGVAERANRSIMEKARCMLQEAGLDKKYWAEAVNTAVYLKNRSPTIALKGCTPEHSWTNKKISISHLRIFGCVAYVQQNKRTKLDPKAKPYIFIGYCDNTKGYRLINPENRKCIIGRNVTFLENLFLKDIVSHDDNIVVHTPCFQVNNTQPPIESSAEESFSVSTHSDDTTIIQNIDNSEIQRQSIISVNDSESEEEDYNSNVSIDNTYIPDETLEEESSDISMTFSDCDDSMLANLARGLDINADEPQTVQEALSGADADNWRIAMKDEYKSFITNKCWTLTDRIKEQKPIKCKWVFKKKYDANGKLLKYKARLVAKGFNQRKGIDYHETFSPVVRYSSIRTLLAIAAEYDMDIDQLDVKTAFLNGDLNETVYMEQPEGFIIKGSENKIYRLNKAIYGLKQAAKAWYEKISKVLCDLGFTKLSSEPCVYYKSSSEGLLIIALYVDDILLFSPHNSVEKNKIKQKLQVEFDITDLGPAHYILGIDICKTKDSITLNQSSYIQKVLIKYKMEECKASPTPMETGIKLKKGDKNNKNCSKYDYRGLIGSLMYIAVGTRPDIAHAVGYLSQFNDCYEENHWKSAKRVLRYLKGTKDMSLTFVKGGLELSAYADADWGRCETDRRSYTGYVFKIGKSVVSWESRKQRTVALSSTEAEYMALSDTCKEAMFLRQFLCELLGKLYTVTIYNDNLSAQKLCKNSMFHSRTKHIDIRHHFIREQINNKTVDVKYVCTSEMIADVFTKPLCKDVHCKFVRELMLK